MQRLAGRLRSGPTLVRSPLQQWQSRGARKSAARRAIRPGQPLRENFRLFQLPNLVLDLDAEDSPYVRNFNKEDKVQQREKWATDPKFGDSLLKAKHHMPEIQQARDRLQRTRSDAYSPWRISPADVLSVALTGLSGPDPPSEADAKIWRRYGELQNVVHHNGIPSQALRNRSRVAVYLQQEIQRIRIHANDDMSSRFVEAITQRDNITEVRRVLFQTVLSVGGPGLISKSSSQIADTIRRLDGLSPERAPETLTLLNNLTANLESVNSSLPEDLCFLALETSAVLRQFSAIQKYLAIGLRLGYFPRREREDFPVIPRVFSHIRRALRAPVVDEPKSPPAATLQGTGNKIEREELFTLLTGISLVRRVAIPSLRETLLEGAAYDQARKDYLWLLEQIGAIRTLWYERRRLMRQGQGHDLKALEELTSQGLSGDYLKDAARDLAELGAM